MHIGDSCIGHAVCFFLSVKFSKFVTVTFWVSVRDNFVVLSDSIARRLSNTAVFVRPLSSDHVLSGLLKCR